MPGQGRLGDKANIPSDAHGCPACPHPCTGPAILGSPDVNANKRPALRVGDNGIHAACCGTNTWTADAGSPTVFINGKRAFRMGDASKHCGGRGQLVEGSPNVIVGEETTSPAGAAAGGGSRASDQGDGGGGDGGAGGGGTGAGSGPGRTPATAPPPADERPTAFVLSRRMVGIGGTPLVEHQVELIDPDTGRRALGPFTTDADGHLFVEVPDDRPYHLRVIDDEELDEMPPPPEMVPDDEAVFTVVLVDLAHQPLANRRWRATRDGHSFTGETGADGAIFRAGVTPGVYDLEIGASTYKVHTLHQSDLHDEGSCKLIVR